MPSERTFVTEIATALGMVGTTELQTVIDARPQVFANLSSEDWRRAESLWDDGRFIFEFQAGFANGRAFLAAADALNNRRPRIIEWTGGRRPPGDEVVPSDLRVDHVYLVSCKYLSQILHNPSPARLIEGLLTYGSAVDLSDWYQRIAPLEHQALYEACVDAVPGLVLPSRVADLRRPERRQLALALRGAWPNDAATRYAQLCEAVSESTADLWRARLATASAEAFTWRLLRIGSAPYFILGASRTGSMRLRVDTPWDWRQRFRFRRLEILPQPGGQPRVGWTLTYEIRRTGEERRVEGHVELRWSHGRFGQPPEAKVYLDSPHRDVPGYHPL